MDPIQAILAGVPTEDDKLAAMGAALRDENILGQIAQVSGDKVLAPLGQQISSGAMDKAAFLGQDRYKRELMEAQERMAQQRNDAMAARYADQVTRANAQQAAVQNRFNQTKAKQLSDTFQREGLTQTVPAMQEMHRLLQDSTGEDLAGVGMADRPIAELTAKGREMRRVLQSIINPILLARSGAAVTSQEEARLLRELGDGTISTDADFRAAMDFLFRATTSQINSLYGGYAPEVVEMYQTQSGGYGIPKDPFTYTAPGQSEEDRYGLSEDDYQFALDNNLLPVSR